MLRPATTLLFLMTIGALAAAGQAHADAGCVDFKWDVTQERALFAQTPVPLDAGVDLKDARAIEPDRLYAIRLSKQDQVKYAVLPGKKNPPADAFGGVLLLRIPAGGDYRIAIDSPLWIDVVSSGALMEPKDFQGQHACGAPHKIVVFELTASQGLVLQLSSASAERVLVTLTRAPQRKY